MEVVASLSQGRTASAHCGLFTHKSVPVIFEPPCISCDEKSESLSVCTQAYISKVNLCLCLVTHHTRKALGCLEVQRHALFTNEDELCYSRFG